MGHPCVKQLPRTILNDMNDCLIDILHTLLFIGGGYCGELIADRAQSPHAGEAWLEVGVRIIHRGGPWNKVPCYHQIFHNVLPCIILSLPRIIHKEARVEFMMGS